MPIDLLRGERERLISALRVALTAVAFLWVFHVARWLLGFDATALGIIPRTLSGLPGVLTAPLVHGDLGHLANNSVPLVSTLFLLVYFYPRIALRATLSMYVVTGLGVWLLARGAGWGADLSISHIGASGVAYALVSFLFWFGVFKRSAQSVVVALVILLYFSGMIAGVLPDQINVSWESHLIGALVGAGGAWRYRDALVGHRPEPDKELYRSTPYFPADTFAYTMAEREEMRRAALEAERQRRLAEELALAMERDRRLRQTEERDAAERERWRRMGEW